VVPVLEELHQYAPHHHYYPPDTMHVTICKLGQFASDDPGAAARLGELRHIAASHPSFDLTMRGLNLSPTTAFAQVFPHDQTFHSLRRHPGGIAERNVDRSSSERVIEGVARNLAHANVVRFSDLVTREFIKEISRFRQTPLGRWTVREIEVVRSDKLLSREGLHLIERMPLTGFSEA
jgi:2'-5' RNA ligase